MRRTSTTASGEEIGTYNGWGGGFCPNDYDANWSIYTDGETDGMYFCHLVQADVYTAGSNPAFSISYAWCASSLSYRWVLRLGGTDPANATFRECYSNGKSAGWVVRAGLETSGTSSVDRDIDVKYAQMKFRLYSGATWYDLATNTGPYGFNSVRPNYTYQFVGAQAFNVYLAPLN